MPSIKLFPWALASAFQASLVVAFLFHQHLGSFNDSYETWNFIRQNCAHLEASQAAFGLSLFVCEISHSGVVNLLIYLLCFSIISIALVSVKWVLNTSPFHLPAIAYIATVAIFWLGGTKESITILGLTSLVMACFRPSIASIVLVGPIILLLSSRSLVYGFWGVGLTFLCLLVSSVYDTALEKKNARAIFVLAVLALTASFSASSVFPSFDRKALIYGDDAVITLDNKKSQYPCDLMSGRIRGCLLEVVQGYSTNGKGSSWDYDQEMASLRFGLSETGVAEPIGIAIKRSYNVWSPSNVLHLSHSIFSWSSIGLGILILLLIYQKFYALKGSNKIVGVMFVFICIWCAWFFAVGLIGSFIPNNNTLIRYLSGPAISVYYFQLHLIGKLDEK